MPTRWETFPIACNGGLVTNVSPLQLGINSPGAASRLVNFEPSIQGGYRRINGYIKWDTNEVTGTGQVWGVGFFDGAVIAARNGNIYESTGGGWTSIASGRTQTTKQRYTIINLDGTRKIIGLDGSNYPYSWDGTNFVNINGTTDINGATHAVQFKDHVFYASGNLITYSEPFDETAFTAANGSGSFRVPSDVTGLIVFRERLFVFTEREIRVVDGSSDADWQITSVSNDIGCVQPDTVQEVAGDIAFMAPDGIRLLGATDRVGDFSNQLASRNIQSKLNSFEQDYSFFSACTVRGKSQYRVFGFLSGRPPSLSQGYVGTQFESQNPNSFSWAELNGFKVYSIDSKIYQDDEYIVFCSDTGFVYRMESGSSFDGVDIEAEYWTPYLSLTDPIYRKTIYKVHMYFDPEGDIEGTLGLNFDFNVDNKIQPSTVDLSASGGGAVYGMALYGSAIYADAPSSVIDKLVVGAGFNVSLRYIFSGNEPFILDTIIVEFATEDRK